MNKVIIIGNLGQDPEVRKGGAVSFSVATSEKWKSKDGEAQEHTEWHNIVAFGKTGELCAQYLAKGRKVCVEGKIRTDEWTDKDGETRKSKSIIAERVHFLSSAQQDGGGGSSQGNRSPSAKSDDIPF